MLNDFSDFGFGEADILPTDHISIGLIPFDYVYETVPSNERMNWLMNHELLHIVAADKPSSRDRFFRGLFLGKVVPATEAPLSIFYSYLTNPRRYSPRWYHEGSAVFMETWLSGGLGRVLGGYDEMVFRAKVRDQGYLYHYVGLESEGTTIDFQIGANSYLYGTRFMTYLTSQYGPEKFLEWISRTDESSSYFASQFEKVYEVSLKDAWTEWIEFEHKWQESNLERIREYPVTAMKPISNKRLGSVSRAYFDEKRGRLYAAVRYPGRALIWPPLTWRRAASTKLLMLPVRRFTTSLRWPLISPPTPFSSQPIISPGGTFTEWT